MLMTFEQAGFLTQLHFQHVRLLSFVLRTWVTPFSDTCKQTQLIGQKSRDQTYLCDWLSIPEDEKCAELDH